jgi:hypothetical protein
LANRGRKLGGAGADGRVAMGSARGAQGVERSRESREDEGTAKVQLRPEGCPAADTAYMTVAKQALQYNLLQLDHEGYK